MKTGLKTNLFVTGLIISGFLLWAIGSTDAMVDEGDNSQPKDNLQDIGKINNQTVS